jgi:N-acetylglucosaminyldiphosphoundecaprenol N-acetyl-beta-D-mannosaminyltransferase
MNKLLAKTWRYPLELGSSFEKKLLISTLNTHSFNVALKDREFYDSLMQSDILLPDGHGVVLALRFLENIRVKKIAGYDLLIYELSQLNIIEGKCFFLGSTNKVLDLIEKRILVEFPNVKVKTFSPPFMPEFSAEMSNQMIELVNEFEPHVLFVGMTAPKQEKWAHANFEAINAWHVDCVGATFDFFAGTVKRAPDWMIFWGIEWLFRLLSEPRRLWERYLIGNPKFLLFLVKEKYKKERESKKL